MFISAAISQGVPYRLFILWAREIAFELIVSYRLLYELEIVLLRPYFRRKLAYEEVLEYVLWIHEKASLPIVCCYWT